MSDSQDFEFKILEVYEQRNLILLIYPATTYVIRIITFIKYRAYTRGIVNYLK